MSWRSIQISHSVISVPHPSCLTAIGRFCKNSFEEKSVNVLQEEGFKRRFVRITPNSWQNCNDVKVFLEYESVLGRKLPSVLPRCYMHKAQMLRWEKRPRNSCCNILHVLQHNTFDSGYNGYRNCALEYITQPNTLLALQGKEPGRALVNNCFMYLYVISTVPNFQYSMLNIGGSWTTVTKYNLF